MQTTAPMHEGQAAMIVWLPVGWLALNALIVLLGYRAHSHRRAFVVRQQIREATWLAGDRRLRRMPDGANGEYAQLKTGRSRFESW